MVEWLEVAKALGLVAVPVVGLVYIATKVFPAMMQDFRSEMKSFREAFESDTAKDREAFHTSLREQRQDFVQELNAQRKDFIKVLDTGDK